ncbi:neurensin-2 [Candoia aspera]|uniref:neurensin-2 n=1 Tax=Candoia aspera TaxID=51853 RepID=UPI002FD7EB9E
MATASEPTCGCQRGPNMEQGKWYGVRSYLHLFYEDCTGTRMDEDSEDTSTSPAKGGWTPIFWKVMLSAGTLLLLTGAVALATGYLLPAKLEGIGEAEFVVLDQQAAEYNRALGICRAAGVALCAVAGVLLVACILSSGLCGMNLGGNRGEDGKEEQLSPILQENPPPQRGTIISATPAPFQVSWVQSVQPKREM